MMTSLGEFGSIKGMTFACIVCINGAYDLHGARSILATPLMHGHVYTDA